MLNKIPDLIKNITLIKGFHKALKTFLQETSEFTSGILARTIKMKYILPGVGSYFCRFHFVADVDCPNFNCTSRASPVLPCFTG